MCSLKKDTRTSGVRRALDPLCELIHFRRNQKTRSPEDPHHLPFLGATLILSGVVFAEKADPLIRKSESGRAGEAGV